MPHFPDLSTVNVQKSEDAKTVRYTWHNKHGRLHRIGEPAFIVYDKSTGETIQERWYIDGHMHRDGAPAMTVYKPGRVHELWYAHDLLHREDGPASIIRNGSENFYLYGAALTKRQHQKLMHLPLLDRLIYLLKKTENFSYFYKLIKPLDPLLAKSLKAAQNLA